MLTEAAKAAKLRYREKHPDRVRAQRRATYAKSPRMRLRARAYSRARQGIVPTRPEPGTCELCGKVPNGKGCAATLHADHDHLTGVFRGWLCTQCNSGIGKLGDSVVSLKRAIAYLEKPQCLLS